MSGDPKDPQDFGSSEGWESLVEDLDGPTLAPNPELEAAMQEAAEAIPDGAPRKQPEPKPEELVLSNPIERAPADEALRLQVELTEANDRLLRLQADFDNFRKRAAREHQEAIQFGPQNLVKDLLSVVDNMDRAIDHAQQSAGGDLQGLLQGVELVQRELLAVLAKHHVTEIAAQGESFNPAYHEAMAQVPDETAQPNTIADVLQKGYQMRDRLLRPAKVVVTRAPDGTGDGGQGEATD